MEAAHKRTSEADKGTASVAENSKEQNKQYNQYNPRNRNLCYGLAVQIAVGQRVYRGIPLRRCQTVFNINLVYNGIGYIEQTVRKIILFQVTQSVEVYNSACLTVRQCALKPIAYGNVNFPFIGGEQNYYTVVLFLVSYAPFPADFQSILPRLVAVKAFHRNNYYLCSRGIIKSDGF